MPKVDFYILSHTSELPSWFFACQLIEKIYQSQQSTLVYANSKIDAERFDLLLWTYRDDSFIPHDLYHTNFAVSASPLTSCSNVLIEIGYGEIKSYQKDILLNLSNQLPSGHQQVNQIIEIIYNESMIKQRGRERFLLYREQYHYPLNVIKI